jgi:hypothetical protein
MKVLYKSLKNNQQNQENVKPFEPYLRALSMCFRNCLRESWTTGSIRFLKQLSAIGIKFDDDLSKTTFSFPDRGGSMLEPVQMQHKSLTVAPSTKQMAIFNQEMIISNSFHVTQSVIFFSAFKFLEYCKYCNTINILNFNH